jgi:enoyl-CoA hydratase
MELILTGARVSAVDAERWGIVSRVAPVASLLTEALALAATIASMPPVAVRAASTAIDMAFETTLRDGIVDERRRFADLFDTHDQAEGMRAFLERRPPRWTGD